MQVILPIQQWRHFRQYRVNQLAERDTQGHQRISKDTKRTPKVRNFIFNNEVPKSNAYPIHKTGPHIMSWSVFYLHIVCRPSKFLFGISDSSSRQGVTSQILGRPEEADMGRRPARPETVIIQ